MKKRKIILSLSAIPVLTLCATSISTSCGEKPKNKPSIENLKKLENEVKRIEQMKIFDNLLETNETDPSKIELNKKFASSQDVNEFKQALAKAKSVASEDEAESELLKLRQALDKFLSSIKTGSKSSTITPPNPTPIPNPNPNPIVPSVTDWKEVQETIDGITYSKFSKLGTILGLSSTKTVRENIELLKDTTKDNDIISSISAVAYNEYEGKITVSVKITSRGNELGTHEIEMSGFKSFDLPKEQKATSVKVDLKKLIKEKKKLEQISDNDLENYIQKFEVLGTKSATLDIQKLIVEYKDYFNSKSYSLVGNNKDELNFSGEFQYKKLAKGLSVETVKVKIEFLKAKIDNSTYTKQDILDYIISTARVEENNSAITDAFASSYLEKFRSLKSIALTLIKHDDEDYFNDQNLKIQTENENIETDDNDGTMKINYQLSVEDASNQKVVSKEYKEITVKGFKKIDDKYLSKKIAIVVSVDTTGSKKLKDEVRSAYNSGKFELDENWIKNKIGNSSHIFVRRENSGVNEILKYIKHTYFNLLGNGTDFTNSIINKAINFDDRNKTQNQFEVETIAVNFKKIEIPQNVSGNRVSFKISYEVIVSSTDKNKLDVKFSAVTNSFFVIN
ncbi:hypothetical protein NPA07_01255 [Mycoplasmopsis caviae]|uniref:Lipoprotein-associated type-17 domain-containing protein n=1 Tax=Mycoplasmopsis caviae TaxID=55603 RepID=A0A3P8KLV2_9BACT|nr:hypothetical protein [Mycoplasmopsis caviae]UUD35485.1 hypothetical protein NPA07_01255 [Mycoplasmopsis caviae]VDR41738.1 Uncharacterised protein [Mycoplasmopsis caviae]